MATKPPTAGIFSKVANIFRPPGADKGDPADSVVSQQSMVAETEKHALKALIQRKRQDDLVRRREFNYLRKLRKSPHTIGLINHDPSERISTFQTSSGFVVDDRATTLKKIDAIEAHMVSSWARGKIAAVMPMPDKKGGIPVPPAELPVLTTPAKAMPSPAEIANKTSRSAPLDEGSAPAELDNLDLDFTGLLSAPGSAAVDTWDAPVEDSATVPPAAETEPAALGDQSAGQRGDDLAVYPATVPAGLDFPVLPVLQDAAQDPVPAVSQAPAAVVPLKVAARLEVPVPVADLEPLAEHIESGLQDAAIQFAEGDSASAEAVLLGLLQEGGLNVRGADVLASALFDLYRATGQQDGFDVVAMDYAERFGRSPAEWFSLPELLVDHAQTSIAVIAEQVPVGSQAAVWDAPKLLKAQAVSALRKQFASRDAHWGVDWLALDDIAQDGAVALAELFTYWCETPLEMHWSGVEALLRVLERHTPPDDASADPLWWRLRLDALCILQRHDDFESLALDYCVVYEVSPPSWKPAACTCVQDKPNSQFSALADGPPSNFGDDLPVLAGPYASCELVGDLFAGAPDALDRLKSASESADSVVVSCALLVRLDFPTAGDVLNWAIERQAAGCHVQFVHVPRLVAVFFSMLGIDRYAKISVRSN